MALGGQTEWWCGWGSFVLAPKRTAARVVQAAGRKQQQAIVSKGARHAQQEQQEPAAPLWLSVQQCVFLGAGGTCVQQSQEFTQKAHMAVSTLGAAAAAHSSVARTPQSCFQLPSCCDAAAAVQVTHCWGLGVGLCTALGGRRK